MQSLFASFPSLASKLPTAGVAALPTPVEAMAGAGIEGLYVKRDDVSGAPYGGNKVRKLELLLGHAQAAGYRAVLTFGCVGSNHALATAIYAQALGLRAHSVLFPQPVSRNVRKNLLRHYQTGAVMHHCVSGRRGAIATREVFAAEYRRGGKPPLVIAPGGSSPVGTLGFVDAAFELRDQVAAGLLAEPEVVYVPSGTMGTCVGLALGFAAAGLKTRVEAVAVTVPPYTSEARAETLFATTCAMMRECDASFPALEFDAGRFTLRHGYLGPSYGTYTEAGLTAVARAKERGIKLEGTYTGKAFAALIDDAAAGNLAGQTVLYWNTYNSRDFGGEIAGADYHALPEGFHRYFEDAVQELDR